MKISHVIQMFSDGTIKFHGFVGQVYYMGRWYMAILNFLENIFMNLLKLES